MIIFPASSYSGPAAFNDHFNRQPVDDPTQSAQMEAMTERKSGPLSDPRTATIAWAHYRRTMRWMALAALIAVLLALVYLKLSVGMLPLSMVIATIAGVGLSVLLGTALMGLVFLSSGTGHDDHISTPETDTDERTR